MKIHTFDRILINFILLVTTFQATNAILNRHGLGTTAAFHRFNTKNPQLVSKFQQRHSFLNTNIIVENVCQLRGGGEGEGNEEENENENEVENNNGDEERYSRQVYTLGARAHSLVRSSTIVIDGPAASGLVYEIVKNLALSGVGQIIILSNKNNNEDDENVMKKDSNYYCGELDDLGKTYQRGALAECFPNHDSNDNNNEEENIKDLDLILEYTKRLNPSVKVQTTTRDDFIKYINNEVDDGNTLEDDAKMLGQNKVFLSVDRPQSTQLMLNNKCREKSIPFISVETAGVYGRIFCDFGNEFYVVDEDGETPKITLLDKVACSQDDDQNGITKNKQGDITMYCVEGEHHDVSKGDVIEFQWKSDRNIISEDCTNSEENLRCHVLYVKNPSCFTATFSSKSDSDSASDIIERINSNANSFSRVKVPKALSFLSLSEALQNINDPRQEIFAASDLDKSFDIPRRNAIMASFETLDKFVGQQGALPSALNKKEESTDIQTFAKMAGVKETPSLKPIVDLFVSCAKAKFMPIQAIYGALGAQEALKAASGLYNPIKQFLLYDCDEVLKGIKDKKVFESKKNDNSAAGIKYILGKKLTKKLASQKLFVVGSGAIGCEILKNLASIDAGTRHKKGGSIILTDMDTIEKSNLSRQLLFRDTDVGKFKSAAAHEAVQRLNPRVQLDIHTSKVGEDSASKNSSFNDAFWSDGVDVIMNALDNVEARLYMDSQCVANRKAMIDAGTLGAKGNVQVVVPSQSESYGSSVDPPEPTIPVCTLKNFPYEISHTIQWGRDLFDGLFSRRPGQVNEYATTLSTTTPEEFSRILLKKLGEEAALEVASELAEDVLVFDTETSFETLKESSLNWAVNLSRKLFCSAMQELLKQHPLDHLDEDGIPFWSGTRRAPSPLLYIEDEDTSEEQKRINENIVDFVRYTARLRIETFMSNDVTNLPESSDITLEDVKLALNSKNIDECSSEADESEEKSIDDQIRDQLEVPKLVANRFSNKLNIESFEKDDDTNGHVAFVTAASNLRAIAYGIAPVDAMETRRVAGRIVPAMITTTALVSALSCLELIKLVQNAPLKSYRNAFVNLALPFFAFTAPLPAEKFEGLHGSAHTIWDRIIIKESEKSHEKGGITLRRLISQIKKASPSSDDGDVMEVANISFGPYMLYANFLHEDDSSVLDNSVFDLVTEAILSDGDDLEMDMDEFDDNDDAKFDSSQSIDRNKLSEVQQNEVKSLEQRSFLDLNVIVEDPNTGEEAELPPVRIKFHVC